MTREPAALAALLILAETGNAPAPQLTAEEADAVASWLAGFIVGQWRAMGADPAEVGRMMLHRYQGAQN